MTFIYVHDVFLYSDDKVDIFALEEQALGLRGNNMLSRVNSDAAMSEDGKSEVKTSLN